MKNINSKKIIITLSFFALIIILGTSIAKAFYTNTSSMRVLASLVGDFDSGDGDINMMFYMQNDDGYYVRSYAIPTLGYTFDDTKTNCTTTCSNSDTSAACYYSYNSDNYTFTMDSDDKVTCKFYFNKIVDPDVIVNILKEDSEGTYEYGAKKYSLSENIPAFGYDYVNYSCDNNSTVEYIPSSRKFKVKAAKKEVCYVYFDANDAEADIIVNIYIKENSEYQKVEYIPENKTYELSQTETSSCTGGATVTYYGGYINIDSNEKQTCTVYLDLITE